MYGNFGFRLDCLTRARNVYTVSGVRVCVDREDGGLPGAVGVCGALSVCVGTCVCVWVWYCRSDLDRLCEVGRVHDGQQHRTQNRGWGSTVGVTAS